MPKALFNFKYEVGDTVSWVGNRVDHTGIITNRMRDPDGVTYKIHDKYYNKNYIVDENQLKRG